MPTFSLPSWNFRSGIHFYKFLHLHHLLGLLFFFLSPPAKAESFAIRHRTFSHVFSKFAHRLISDQFKFQFPRSPFSTAVGSTSRTVSFFFFFLLFSPSARHYQSCQNDIQRGWLSSYRKLRRHYIQITHQIKNCWLYTLLDNLAPCTLYQTSLNCE